MVELKVLLDLHQPVNKDGAHGGCDVTLFGAQVRRDTEHVLWVMNNSSPWIDLSRG